MISKSRTLQVGDKVELVNGYDKYGDASGGPLQPGDRGTVVELQRGPNGERYVTWSLKKASLCISKMISRILYAGALYAFCTTVGGGGINRKQCCPSGRAWSSRLVSGSFAECFGRIATTT
jgi:hypothetical protein